MVVAKFAGNKKINVEAEGFTINVDLPKNNGGDATAPNPFVLMLSSLLACSAYHLLFFVEKLGLNREDFHMELIPELDANGDMQKALIKIFVPDTFPKEREASLIGSVSTCKVGKHLKAQRTIEIVRK